MRRLNNLCEGHTTTNRSMDGAWPMCAGSSGSRRSCPAFGGSTSRSTTAARARSSSARCASSDPTGSGSPRRSVPGRQRSGGWSWRPTPRTRPSASRAPSGRGRTTGRRGRWWRARTANCCRHATKGLEFDHVVVVGMEIGRFPSARAVGSAEDPVRACEEERRLAYVAWTRARRSLTLLYDPAVPSRSCSRRSAPMSSGSAPRPAEFAHERLDLYPEARKPVAFTGPTSVDEGDVGVKGSRIRITPPSDTQTVEHSPSFDRRSGSPPDLRCLVTGGHGQARPAMWSLRHVVRDVRLDYSLQVPTKGCPGSGS